MFYLLILSVILTNFYISNNTIEIIDYKIKSKKIPDDFNNFKILQLSDLHDKQFGKNNLNLIKRIDKVNPDIIVITGDMLLRKKVNYNIFLKLAFVLSEKYKIYFIPGNHEQRIRMKDKRLYSFLKELKSMGIIILNNKKINLIKNNSYINLYGFRINLKYYKYGLFYKRPVFKTEELKNKLGDLDKTKYNILLAHNPLYFKNYAQWGADLTLSGHVHGGMIRLPFIGGLLSPERKFFPKYSYGKYKIKNHTLIVSKGLGSGVIHFRLFNKPDLSVIILNKI